MSPVPVASHDVSATRPARPASASTTSSSPSATASVAQRALARDATDDEILEIVGPGRQRPGAKTAAEDPDGQREFNFDKRAADASSPGEEQHASLESSSEPENLRPILDANPELRQAWQDANAYREAFATPEDARAATTQLADLDRLDALFFSRRPEDHAQLARSIASLDPAAFALLAQAMVQLTPRPQARELDEADRGANARGDVSAARNEPRQQSQPQSENLEHREAPASTQREPSEPNAAQADFFQAANAEAVQSVLGAIESQVERLLPDGVSKSARNRVVGEIYRELDSALQSNRQFGRQMREAFRSGALDADHQRAIVSLITGRARQALPGVAKRVLSEWASTVIAANHDRRTRQRAAEGRVDIVGSGGASNEGRRSMAPRDIDYARMSDSEILNL